MLPTNRILKRKIRLAQSEVKMLQSYCDECLELLKEYEVEFSQDISYFKKQVHGEPEPPPHTDEKPIGENIPVEPGLWEKTEDGWEKIKDHENKSKSTEASSQKHIPDWAKKLYKKIALATHPDKVTGHTMEEILIKRFLKAGQSYEAGEYDELVTIALDLNIEIEMDDEAMHITLSKQRDSLRKKITEIESSLAWIWCENQGDHELKARILSSQLQHSMNISDLEDMISKKEGHNAKR